MSSDPARRLAAATDRVCHLLWLLGRQEPEIIRLVEKRRSQGYAHYLTSRLGRLPEDRWTALVRVVPSSLVDHLMPRCRELDPPHYVLEVIEAAGAALRRLHPTAPPAALARLARGGPVEGELAQSWAALDAPSDPHQAAVVDSMVLREERAHLHYAAAAEHDFSDLQLLLLNAAWRGRPPGPTGALFRWPEAEVEGALLALRERGLMEDPVQLTSDGRRLREALELATDRRARAALANRGIGELEPMVGELELLLDA